MNPLSLIHSVFARSALLTVPLLAAWPQQARAGSASWNVNAAGNWNAPANWTPNNTFPNGPADVATITNDISAARIISLGAVAQNITVNDLNLGDSNASHSFTIAPGLAGNTLIFGGASPSLDILTGPVHTISAPVQFDADTVLRSQTTNQHVLSGGLRDGGAARVITFNNDTNGIARPAASVEGQFIVNTVAAAFDPGTTIHVDDVRLNTNFAGALGAAASNSITVTGAGQLYVSGATHVNDLVLDSTGWVEGVGNLGALRLENGTVSGSVKLLQDTIVGNNANNTGTLSGPINGAFNITKVGGTTTAGQGVIQLSGDNSGWSGNLVVNRGAVRFGNALAQGSGTDILVDGSNIPVGVFAAGQLGANLELAGSAAYGAGKTLTLRTGTLAQNYRASVVNQAGSNSWDGPVVLSSMEPGGALAQFINNVAGNTLTLNGTVTTTGPNYPGTLFFRGSSSGVIAPAAKFDMPNTDFAKTDSGTWTISSTGNNWRNSIAADGTIQLGATDALDPTGDLVIGQGSATTGQVDLNGFDQTVAAFTSNPLSSSAGLILKNTAAGPSALRFFTTSLTDTFKGTLSGSVILQKNGPGNFTFNSTLPSVVVPAWTGAISVNAGGLTLTGPATLGDPTALVRLADGTMMSGEGSLGGSLVLGTALGMARFEVDGASASALSLGGTLTTNGTIPVATSSGFPAAGIARLINVAAPPLGGGLPAFDVSGLNLRGPAVVFNALPVPGVDLTYTSLPLRWNNANGPIWDVGVTASWQGPLIPPMTAMNGDALTLDDLPGVDQKIAVTGVVMPGSVTFDNAAISYLIVGGPGASIATPITKQNTGTAIIGFDNPSPQPAVINGGTLQLGDGGTVGSLTGPIDNNRSLVFNHGAGAIIPIPGVISGGGDITKNGAGTVVLTGASTAIGACFVNDGILEVDRDTGNIANPTVNVNGSGILSYTRNDGGFAFDREVAGGGTVSLNPHAAIGGSASHSITITSVSPGFAGKWILPSPTTGTYRVNGAVAAAYGNGSIEVQNRAQVLAAASQVYTNPITITGTGYADTNGNIGALRIDNTNWNGPVIIAGAARIGAHNTALTTAGIVSGDISGGDLEVNVTNYNNNYTVVFTGTNSYGTTTIGGGNTQTAGTPSMRLNIGNGGTTGTLGNGAVTINGDSANGILGFDRSDGFTLKSGNTITGAGSRPDRTYVDFDTQGTGFDNNGQTIDLGTAGGIGGQLRAGVTRTDTVTTFSGLVEAGVLLVGTFNATVPTTNAAVTISSGGTVSVTNVSVPAGGGSTPFGNSSGASLTIAAGGTLNAATQFFLGDANTGAGTVNHNGDAVVGQQVRVGHWPNGLSTYNMNSGALTLTGDSPLFTPSTSGGGAANATGDNNLNALPVVATVGGGIYIGIDGTGVFNHNGGTVTTNWIVLDNRGNSTVGGDGIDRYNLSGSGLLLLRSEWGIIARNTSTEVNLGGGTIRLDNTGTGGPVGNTGPDLDVPLSAILNTVAATTTTLDTNGVDNAFLLLRDVTGSGLLDLQGGGTVQIGNAGTQIISAGFTGSTGITKANPGTTILSGNSSGYTGVTTVSTGVLQVDGTLGGSVVVQSGGTLAGNGATGTVTVQSGGIVSPGASVGTLGAASANLQTGSRYDVEITAAATADKLNVTGALTTDGMIKVMLIGYVPVAGDSFDIADAASFAGSPTFDFTSAVLSAGLLWDASQFPTDGTIRVVSGDPYDAWAALYGVTGGKTGDDDKDGASNLLEFATNSHPLTNGSGPRTYDRLHPLGGDQVLTLTIATRSGAAFSGAVQQTATKDKIIYTVAGSDDLAIWNTVVISELNAVDSAAVQAALGLPTLDTGWEWHSFRTDGGTSSDPRDFIRLSVAPQP
ncbi:MAG: autotransporter-associated beta strand repeat-containing protein [Verrucomicrobiales bacterium]|nr:autotransporter-associated beta strand repeat-containing protein [Verrucomicrobiales bacterium]